MSELVECKSFNRTNRWLCAPRVHQESYKVVQTTLLMSQFLTTLMSEWAAARARIQGQMPRLAAPHPRDYDPQTFPRVSATDPPVGEEDDPI